MNTSSLILSWDERRLVAMPGDSSQTLLFAREHFFQAASSAIQSRGRCSIALAGGSTPKALYKLITAEDQRDRLDWSRLHLFWGDERWVCPEDPESNYHMAMEAGWSRVSIPPQQIHRMPTDSSDYHGQAASYEKLLKSAWSRGLDIALLGVGEDGHTASLFPHTAALAIQNQFAAANFVPQKNCWRMTLTFPYLALCHTTAIYAIGSSKAAIVRQALSDPQAGLPIQHIGTKDKAALWIIDKEAAARLGH